MIGFRLELKAPQLLQPTCVVLLLMFRTYTRFIGLSCGFFSLILQLDSTGCSKLTRKGRW